MPPFTRFCALAGLFLGVSACADGTSTTAPLSTAEHALVAPTAEDPASALAQGIALALSRPELRQQVLEDMRDSPFPRHRLHLASYLHGERGMRLATAAAGALRIERGLYLALLNRLPEMEFHMARPYDRALWTGTDDVVVAGISRSFAELYAEAGSRARMLAFTTDGKAVSIGLDERLEPPLLLIRPAEIRFGRDPEGERRASTRRSGRTISTRQEELTTSDCDPNTAVMECDSSGGGESTIGGYFLTHTLAMCTDVAGYADSDQDRLRDECELEIAKAFAPALRFDQGEQLDGRDPYWSVKTASYTVNALEIFYLLAYHRDGGDVTAGLYAHDGDSEFLVLTVEEVSGAPGRWRLTQMTYSAHWDTGWDRTTRNLPYDQVEYTDTFRGRPRSWVAESKHANYPNQSSCNGNMDSCNNPAADKPIVSPSYLDARNIGNKWAFYGVPLFTAPCAGSMYHPYTECFWTDDTFRGWQSEDGSGAGGYEKSLYWYGF